MRVHVCGFSTCLWFCHDLVLRISGCLSQIHSRNLHKYGHGKLPLHLKSKLAGNWQIIVFIQMILCSFTARQLRHINSEGAHCALSHQCTGAENLKWILDKQLEIPLSVEFLCCVCIQVLVAIVITIAAVWLRSIPPRITTDVRECGGEDVEVRVWR